MKITDNHILYTLDNDKSKGLKLLFERYYKPLCVFAIKYVYDLNLSEDIVQEVFIKVWEKQKFHTQMNLSAYLFASVKNACIDYLRKEHPLYVDSFDDKIVIENYYDEEEILERNRRLMDKVENLPQKTREVFKAVVFYNLKYKEVAEELNISVNTVKSNLARAYRLLREVLDILVSYLL
ncbi:RNA polymerase sigma factor [Labilibaculum euxinus]|uniref:RNA polymerase sigma factor n=1 Tax=Labilibaculum euxinus TaxID=2686357 RepID=UPI000F620C5E|nr:RNA polymerase sigma-70 factor [Labilibaculum euxinus]